MIEYTMDSDFDYTIDEKGNKYVALRKIDWGNKGEFKLDLRKYYSTEAGERMSSGVTMTNESAGELVNVLLKTGYGDDEEIANTIINSRPGVLGRVYKALNQDPELISGLETEDFGEDDDNFYDPEELIA